MDNNLLHENHYNDRVIELKKENNRLKRSIEELSILNELSITIGSLGNTKEILEHIIRHSIDTVCAEQGVITLIDDYSERKKKTLIREVNKIAEQEPFHLTDSMMIWLDRNRKTILSNDPRKDVWFNDVNWDTSINSFLSIPLIVKGHLIGALTVYNKKDSSGFTEEDQRLLSIIGSQSAQVIENARLIEREHIRDIERIRHDQQIQMKFSRQLIESQEQERKRISAELHDSIGQNLLIIKNRAFLALENCTGKNPAIKDLHSISAISSQTIDEIREISNNLHPYLLERLGLTKAVQSMISRVVESSNIQFESDIDLIDNIFTKESEINIYRIIQEGINNALRHAEASTITLNIKKSGNNIIIKVKDNGKGFIVDETLSGAEIQGFGLRGIEERARIINGTLSIKSSLNKGTELSISIHC